MRAIWVVPVRFDPKNPVVFQCIESIQEHHDNPIIIVVDSDSDDKSYLSWCVNHGCRIGPTNNHLRAFGAHAWAYRHNPDADFFYLTFDSVIINANLDYLQERPVTAIRHWSNAMHGWGWDGAGTPLEVWGGQQLERMGIPFPDAYTGIMGPVMFAQKETCDELDKIGYWFAQTTTEYEHCAMERVAGISLAHIGYPITESLQGFHTTHSAEYPENAVRKIDLARV
jgi:hypothetical protein